MIEIKTDTAHGNKIYVVSPSFKNSLDALSIQLGLGMITKTEYDWQIGLLIDKHKQKIAVIKNVGN